MRSFLWMRSKAAVSNPSRSLCAEGRRKISATALLDVIIEGNGLILERAKVLQVQYVLFELLPGHQLKDGLFDEKAVFYPPFPAEMPDLFDHPIVDLDRKQGFLFFHSEIKITTYVTFVNI